MPYTRTVLESLFLTWIFLVEFIFSYSFYLILSEQDYKCFTLLTALIAALLHIRLLYVEILYHAQFPVSPLSPSSFPFLAPLLPSTF